MKPEQPTKAQANSTFLAGLIERLISDVESLQAELEGRITQAYDATLRLDCNCTKAPEDDPLTIDIYDDDGTFESTLYSFSVGKLIEEMISSRTGNGHLDLPDGDKPDPFVLVRDELRELADLIDEALSTREG